MYFKPKFSYVHVATVTIVHILGLAATPKSREIGTMNLFKGHEFVNCLKITLVVNGYQTLPRQPSG